MLTIILSLFKSIKIFFPSCFKYFFLLVVEMPPKSKPRNQKGKHRQFSSPDEIKSDLEKLNLEESEEGSSGDEDSSGSDDELEVRKPKGVSNLIQVENPNFPSRAPDPNAKVQLSRREREELARTKAKEREIRLTAEGKTDKAKADLARLALIRKEREDAALKRKAQLSNKKS